MTDFVTMKAIIRLVAETEGIRENLLHAKRRPANISRARHITFYLIYTLTNYSMPQISKAFSMDHTSILYGIRKIERLRKNDLWLDGKIKNYESKLGNNHRPLQDPSKKAIELRLAGVSPC